MPWANELSIVQSWCILGVLSHYLQAALLYYAAVLTNEYPKNGEIIDVAYNAMPCAVKRIIEQYIKHCVIKKLKYTEK